MLAFTKLVLLLLLSHFSRVQLCATPQTTAHQAPLSLGFSRQEYWSGLPFPSPMHARMLSCFSHVQLCVTPQMAAHQAPPSTEFSRQEYWSGLSFPSLPHLLNLGIFSLCCILLIKDGHKRNPGLRSWESVLQFLMGGAAMYAGWKAIEAAIFRHNYRV